jgi:hypothetical protein
MSTILNHLRASRPDRGRAALMKRTNMNKSIRFGFAIAGIIAVQATTLGRLAAQAANSCPAYSVQSSPNFALNPDFNSVGSCGFTSTWWWQGKTNCPPNGSAALNWMVHSSNQGDYVSTAMVPSTLPIGGGSRMLHIVQGNGAEGGIYQEFPSPSTKVVVSVWVYVRHGHIVLHPNTDTAGPNSWNTMYNEWELLRFCMDGTPLTRINIYNEDPNGADFDVDRVEIKTFN